MDKLYQQSLKWKFDTKNLMKSNNKYTKLFYLQKQAFLNEIDIKWLVDKKGPLTGL